MQTRLQRRKTALPHDDPAEIPPLNDQQSAPDLLPHLLEPTSQPNPTSRAQRRSAEYHRNQAHRKQTRAMTMFLLRAPVSFLPGRLCRTKYLYKYSATPHTLSTMTTHSNIFLRADGLSMLRMSVVPSPSQLSKSFTLHLRSSR